MTRALLPALALLPVFALLSPTVAYAADFEPTATDDPDLVAAWQSWDSRGIDDYTTTVKLTCFCPRIPAVRTVVRNGEIRKVTQGERTLRHRKGHSMDQLFAMIREAHATADRVEVTYTHRGVPKSITVDPEELAIDEELYYSVSLVRP